MNRRISSVIVAIVVVLTAVSCRTRSVPQTHNFLIEARLLQLTIPLHKWGVNWSVLPTDDQLHYSVRAGRGTISSLATDLLTAMLGPQDLTLVLRELTQTGNGSTACAKRLIVPNGGQATIHLGGQSLVLIRAPSAQPEPDASREHRLPPDAKRDLTICLTPTVSASSNMTTQVRVAMSRLRGSKPGTVGPNPQELAPDKVTVIRNVKNRTTLALTGFGDGKNIFEQTEPLVILLTITTVAPRQHPQLEAQEERHSVHSTR